MSNENSPAVAAFASPRGRLLTLEDVRDLLGFSDSWVRRLVRRPGGIPGFRLPGGRQWRAWEGEVLDWVEAQRGPASPAVAEPKIAPAPVAASSADPRRPDAGTACAEPEIAPKPLRGRALARAMAARAALKGETPEPEPAPADADDFADLPF